MPQLKSVLGTSVSYTVLRKLSPLGYRTSYSHGGTYYTLDELAQYDELGLWLAWGHGGQQRTSERFGLDVDTVARGERELLSGEVLRGRVRQPGGGRPAVEKKRPKS